MKHIDTAMSDLKAAIAAEIAQAYKPHERVAYTASTLQIEEDEARQLIARGRRIARERVKAA